MNNLAKIKNKIKPYIPGPIRRMVRGTYRGIYDFSLDTLDALLGRRDEMIPPRKKRFFIGAGDFDKIGQEFLQYFIQLGGLKTNESVLDVGCGIGRMTVPLTKYLDKSGRYEGFDIVTKEINWCREKITPKYPNFRFQVLDVYNKMYNPKGKYKASELRFPYADESFDFVFLTSVFTHMLPHEMENYFCEIVRVLKKHGRCLITFFLLNPESIRLIDAKSSADDFRYSFEGYRVADKDTPEAVIAFDESLIRALYEKHGMQITDPIRYGSWCGRKDFLSYQDLIRAVKK